MSHPPLFPFSSVALSDPTRLMMQHLPLRRSLAAHFQRYSVTSNIQIIWINICKLHSTHTHKPAQIHLVWLIEIKRKISCPFSKPAELDEIYQQRTEPAKMPEIDLIRMSFNLLQYPTCIAAINNQFHARVSPPRNFLWMAHSNYIQNRIKMQRSIGIYRYTISWGARYT